MTLLLVSGATATLRALPPDAPVGHLVTPANGNRLEELAHRPRAVAFDNGCGPRQDGTPGALDETAWYALLDAAERLLRTQGSRARVLWAACPDTVSDAAETLRLWRFYHHQIRARHIPLAFVAQDGCEELPIPWDKLRCLFLGGSTAYKESAAARRLVITAKQLGKLVHIGRVNTERRLRLFDDLGCDASGMPYEVDTIDGTQFSMFPDAYIPRWAERLRPSCRAMQAAHAPAARPMEELWDA